ncbi:MAG: hypothetical protein DRO40_02330 [Thermoprotei archaeon]|nr:MAG: hypothetical protein DRO40_02330 [Thermoprotei archaeon]
MANIPANVFILESSILWDIDNELLLKLLNTLKSYDVLKAEETGYTLVRTVNNRRLYLSIGINSLFIHGNKELHDLFKQHGIRYYVNLKSVWIKTCRLRRDILIGDLLRKTIDRLKTVRQGECIYINDSGNICSSVSNDVKLQICHNITDEENIVPLKPYHPVSYGVIRHVDFYDKRYRKALERYLTEKTNYDTLAYVVVDSNYKSFIDVNEIKRFVRINFIPRSIDLFKLLLNSIFYTLCV